MDHSNADQKGNAENSRIIHKKNQAKLVYYIKLQSSRDFLVDSEVGWINKRKIVLTVDNNYYMINLSHANLKSTETGLLFGLQQVNINIFATIVVQKSLLKQYVDPIDFAKNESSQCSMAELSEKEIAADDITLLSES